MSETIPTPAACVFDLDGTLVDSIRDVADALNHGLSLLGLPEYTVAECQAMVGDGVPMLCQRALGGNHAALAARLAELVRAEYRTCAVRHSRPYAGIEQLIATLRSAGIPLAVLSNKPHELTERVVRAFWPGDTFRQVRGYTHEHLRKPAPDALLQICDALGVSPAKTWMIGDTATDIETARAAGAVSIAVSWGFRSPDELRPAGPDRLFDTPDALRQAVVLSTQPPAR